MADRSYQPKTCNEAVVASHAVTGTAQPRWEHFEHKADIGVRGIGPTMASAFEQAAIALVAVCTDPARIQPVQEIQVQCEAPTPELLLVEWLNTLIYEIATRKMLFGRFNVQICAQRLTATASGEPIDITRHEPAVEVKGATYAELAVRELQPGCWIAQCVVDV